MTPALQQLTRRRWSTLYGQLGTRQLEYYAAVGVYWGF